MTDNMPEVGEGAWERRKAWPLLLGSAVTLSGLAVINYSWANPDGRLTSKAQDALSAQFPGAKVRVHGRDAIVTGLPAGADIDAAHHLVRRIEGVRNVKKDTADADAALVADLADSIAQDSRADATAAVTTVASAGDVAVAGDATEPGAAPVAGAIAPTTMAPAAAPTTATPATTAAPAPTVTTAPPAPTATTLPAASVAPATTLPMAFAAPTTVASAPAESGEGATPEAAPPPKILFDSVSSELHGESKAAVDELLAYLGANPDVRIKVVGHADGWGTRLTNLAVSRARAGSVVSALVSGGVGRDRISAFAHGDRFPVASNATAEGRAANRRVEIVFFGAEGAGEREVAFTG